MLRAIVITSGKGGVGKTTLTANLGRCMARMGLKVALIDTDIGLNNLDVLMNVENKSVYDIIDVIEGRCRVKQALIEDPLTNGLYVLPSVHGYDGSKINGQNIKAVINSFAGFDYVLVDCPAGIEAGFHRAVAACREALVVTTPHVSAIRDADKVIQILKSYGLETSVAVNRARGDLILNKEMLGAEEIRDALKVPLAGIVPEDDGLNLISNLNFVKFSSEGWKALEILARNIHFGSSTIYDVTKKFKGFFGGIRRNLKRNV